MARTSRNARRGDEEWKSERAGAPPRLSAKEAEILQLLVAGGEGYGLDLVRKSEGRLKRGTIYVTLQRMEEKRYVESRPEEKAAGVPGIARRLYKATGLGELALREQQSMRAPDLGVSLQST